MPARRRLSPLQARQADPVAIFRCALDDSFAHYMGEPIGFASRTVAGRAWDIYRRDVWTQQPRFSIPRAARVFDGVTFDSADLLRWQFPNTTIRLDDVLAAVDADRTNLQRFRATPKSKAIRDFLELLRQDIDAVETLARSWAASPAPAWCRMWPRSRRYGSLVPPHSERMH